MCFPGIQKKLKKSVLQRDKKGRIYILFSVSIIH